MLVTLACAGNKLGVEGGHRAQSVLERNTILTKLNLICERVACVEMGGSRPRARVLVFVWRVEARLSPPPAHLPHTV